MTATVTPPVSSFSEERAQLERLLGDPLFSQSRRYTSFLRYVADRTFSNRHEHLTERTLGVEVFGRPPYYDTEADPIVRVTASELRKRLAQYYEAPAHSGEIRLVIQKHSYEVEFLPAETSSPRAVVQDTQAQETREKPEIPQTSETKIGFFTNTNKRRWYYVAAALGVCLLVTGLVREVRPRSSVSDLFWAPIAEGPQAVIVSFPQFSDHVHLEGTDNPKLSWSDALTPTPDPMQANWLLYSKRLVHISDLAVACRMSEFLGSKGKHAVIKGEHDLTMGDLRDTPAVILGGLTNQWTSRLSPRFRFSFDGEGTMRFIRDSQNPDSREWSFDAKVHSGDRVKDYIIVSRVTDSVSGRLTLLAGGFSAWGTEAAVELLSDPNQMERVLGQTPRNWDSRNLQMVMEATVVNRQAGMPRLLAAHFW
jgi:hypothetical protein